MEESRVPAASGTFIWKHVVRLKSKAQVVVTYLILGDTMMFILFLRYLQRDFLLLSLCLTLLLLNSPEPGQHNV